MNLNPFKRKPKRVSRRESAVQSVADEGWLKSTTKRAIVGVILAVFALIELLSFFNQAGVVGQGVLQGLRLVGGWLAYLLPFFLLKISYDLVRPSKEPAQRLQRIGTVLAIIGLLGLFHLVGVPSTDALQVAQEGKGGGYLGFMLSYPLSVALSSVVAILIYVAAFLIGCFLAFNTSFADVEQWLNWFKTTSDEDVGDEGEVTGMGSNEVAAATPRFRINRMALGAPKPDPAQLKLQEKERQAQAEKELAKERLKAQIKAANKKYHLPSLDLLNSSSRQPQSGNITEIKAKIQSTLENFGIAVTMGKVSVGPTVTQFTLQPAEGTKLSRITALQNDLSLALAAHPIRIEAPIPNTSLVGIEIPNKEVALVRLRDLLASKEYKSAESPLTFALGKDVSGQAICDSLERMPHLLIAGATNSGKSVSIHAFMMSLLYRNSPAMVRMILVDPKRVELSAYNNIPHLLTPVIVDPGKTLNALKWALKEMDERYRALEESGSRNLMTYNLKHPEEPKPYIVIVIDELADLMVKHAREVEGPIVRLSQMARAVGIHLVLATQRPSVNVITGLIKANIPSRIAFKVASQIDSRTILDMSGAEKLLGTGDMLYLAGDRAKPLRLQGGYVSEEEVHEVVSYIKENNPVDENTFDTTIVERTREVDGAIEEGDEDDLLEEAKNVVIRSGKASASLLQRRLRVGYARAARLLDMLEERGVIAAAEGNKPREVLMAAGDTGGSSGRYMREPADEGEDLPTSSVEDRPDERW